MLHFGIQTSGHTPVWGMTYLKSSETDPEYQLWQLNARVPRPMLGQFRGGIGMFRTETGQPQVVLTNGEYTFDTYLTTYAFADGSYSLAIEVWLALSEGFALTDAEATSAIRQAILTETVAVAATDAVSAGGLTHITSDEVVTLADTQENVATIAISLSENISLFDAIWQGSTLTSYVVNARTGAVSNYSNFPFNSMAKVGSKYLATSPDGVYELAGTNDDGVDISASVILPTTQLSTEEVPDDVMKRLPTAYLGVSTAGDLVLRVTANGVDNYYTLTGTTATGVHTGRMMLGRGVAARYWDFELTNVNGADFTLESITFHPVALARRIGRR